MKRLIQLDATICTDADGIVIAYGVAELSTGYTLMLPDNLLPGMTLSVTIDGITYSAII